MNSRSVSYFLAVICFALGSFQNLEAGTAQIGHTPILTAALPVNSTYEVEYSSHGDTWISANVLIAGNGSLTTVRLDGFPADRRYRLVSIGGSNVIDPVVTSGLHLGASAFSGAGELRFESVSQLGGGSWAHRAFAFPTLQTPFITPLRSPLSPHAFFRAVQPAQPLVPATISFYQVDTNNTAAGYGMVVDDMPQLYREGRIAALCPSAYHRGGSAAAAGECYELVGPQGKTTVIVADTMGSWPSRTCDVGQPYFDVGERAFTNLFTSGIGFGVATYRLVPAPVAGNLKMVCVIEAGGYYFELRPYNHRAGVSKLEVQGAGGQWTELSRTDYNSFVYNTGTPLTFPFITRVTSRFGEQVTFPAINSMTNGSRFTANGQFNVFPDQGPTPVWILPPVYGDALTNVLGGDWIASTYGGTTVNPSYSGSVYQGTHSLRISTMGAFGGVNFIAPTKFPRQPDSYVEFAIRSEGAVINGLTLQIEGADNTGASLQSTAVTLPPVDGTWRTIRIPLEPAAAPPQILQFRLINSTSSTLPTINLDAVAFRW